MDKIDKYLSSLIGHSDEEIKHHISEKDLENAYVLGRDLNNKTSSINVPFITSLKFSFSPTLYNRRTSVLMLADKEIKIPGDRNEDYFCRVIFLSDKNMRKEWSWDEVIRVSKNRIVPRGKNPEWEPWRPVYNAARKLNDRIAIATGVKDFFLVNPITTVRVNPEYLV